MQKFGNVLACLISLFAICILVVWAGRGLFAPSAVASSAPVTSVIYLPSVFKPWAPMTGYWVNTQNIHWVGQLHVTQDSAYVDQQTIWIMAYECGASYKITHDVPVPIINNQYSFTGPFYASGTFAPDAVTITVGLQNYVIDGCVINRAPYTASYHWTSSPIYDVTSH